MLSRLVIHLLNSVTPQASWRACMVILAGQLAEAPLYVPAIVSPALMGHHPKIILLSSPPKNYLSQQPKVKQGNNSQVRAGDRVPLIFELAVRDRTRFGIVLGSFPTCCGPLCEFMRSVV
jgi:hypothetical protein